MPTESLKFAPWARMAPSMHTSAHAEFHCAYCSQPYKGWGIDHMVHSCPVVLAAALTGFRAMCALLRSRGYAVCWRNSLGATVYDKARRPSHWRLARDEDVVLQSESAAWDMAITWSGLMWSRAPQPWPACERAALMAGYQRAVADWVALPPPARWTRLMRASGSGWPPGLSRPLVDAGTLLWGVASLVGLSLDGVGHWTSQLNDGYSEIPPFPQSPDLGLKPEPDLYAARDLYLNVGKLKGDAISDEEGNSDGYKPF